MFGIDIPIVDDIAGGIGDLASGAWDAGKGIFNKAMGQTDYRAPGAAIPFAADQETILEFQRQKTHYDQAVSGALGPQEQQLAQAMGPPNPQAIQLQQQRARIQSSIDTYNPLVQSLQAQAAGTGPSVALDTYREAQGRNIASQYGMAAGGNVAPGQRAALLGQAAGRAASLDQTAAREAAMIKAQEQQRAQGLLQQAIGARTAAQGGLYEGDLGREKSNLAAATGTQEINAGIEKSNSQQAGETTRSVIGAGAKMLGGA